MSDPLPFLPTTATLMPLPEANDALPVGTFLGEFEIKEVIGVGGFGIVYRAWEAALERDVAIKEYMPMGLVGRAADGRAMLRSAACKDDYALGLRSFVNEARLLARFDHAALVKVHRFWEGNGTAYMAMPFYKAQTLRQRRQDLGAMPVTEAWLMSMIEPLLGALSEMHRAEVFHRDIAPDNILWCSDNRPVLLDFGAARRVLADRTQHLTAVLKPQFAPIEQYADAQSMRQGPWTDIVALASTCYFMITGRPPLPATARILSDDLTPLAELAPAGFSKRILATLDWAMAVRPHDRPQSVAALWDVLHGHASVPERLPPFRIEPTRPTVQAEGWENTVQTTASLAARSTADDVGADSHGSTLVREPSIGLGATLVRVKPIGWLLGLALVAGAGSAWHLMRPADATVDDVQAAAGAASSPMAASEPAMASALPPTADTQPRASAQAREASAPAASAPGRRSAPGASPGPRETCVASKADNVEECVKRACKQDARFKRSSTCLKLQKSAEPWWRIFKHG